MRTRNVLVFALSVFLLAGCAKKEDADEEEKEIVAANVEVHVAKIEQGPIRQIIESGGTLNALPDRDVKVSSLVAGKVNELRIIEGDQVEKGQVIAKIDDSALLDQVRQAKAALDNAKSNMERESKLFERGISAGKEQEDAKRDLVTAQATYDTANLQLSRTLVRSPIRGSIIKRFVSAGEQVDGTAGQPIVEVANFDPLELNASIQSSYVAQLHEGADAEVAVDAFPNRLFRGTVVSILAAVDPATNAVTARIRIPNSDATLKGGMFATARINAGIHPTALSVPAAALVVTNNQPKIYVIGPNSKVKEVKVQEGWRDHGRVEVKGDIRAGETVVTAGSYGLTDGMSVVVKQ